MDKKKLLETLKKLKETSPKRKFTQSVDLVVTLKDLDFKKTENQIDFFASIPFERGSIKTCALIGPELKEEAKNCDTVVMQDEFAKYSANKKLLKKLAAEHDFFIAQANIMPQVAASFGRVLGPRGKMPNPKAGCVVPPKSSLKPLIEKLKKTIRVSAKKDLAVLVKIGKEDMPDEHLIENAASLYEQIISHLPNHQNNVRKAALKLTMSVPVKVEI